MEDISKKRIDIFKGSIELFGVVNDGEYFVDVDLDEVILKLPGECEPCDPEGEYLLFPLKHSFIIEIVYRDSNSKRCKVAEVDLEDKFIDGVLVQMETDPEWYQE